MTAFRPNAKLGLGVLLTVLTGAVWLGAQGAGAAGGKDVTGPSHCHITINPPYSVLKPVRVSGSVQLSCAADVKALRLTVFLYRLDRKHHRWNVVARARKAARATTVLNVAALFRCRSERPAYFEVGAIGKISGKPAWGLERVRVTKTKLACGG